MSSVVDSITVLDDNKKRVLDSLRSKVDTMRKHKNECEENQIHEKLQDNKVLDYLVDKSTVDEPLIKRYKNN